MCSHDAERELHLYQIQIVPCWFVREVGSERSESYIPATNHLSDITFSFVLRTSSGPSCSSTPDDHMICRYIEAAKYAQCNSSGEVCEVVLGPVGGVRNARDLRDVASAAGLKISSVVFTLLLLAYVSAR